MKQITANLQIPRRKQTTPSDATQCTRTKYNKTQHPCTQTRRCKLRHTHTIIQHTIQTNHRWNNGHPRARAPPVQSPDTPCAVAAGHTPPPQDLARQVLKSVNQQNPRNLINNIDKLWNICVCVAARLCFFPQGGSKTLLALPGGGKKISWGVRNFLPLLME